MAKVGNTIRAWLAPLNGLHIAGYTCYFDRHRSYALGYPLHQLSTSTSSTRRKVIVKATSPDSRPSPTRPLYQFYGVLSLLVSSAREEHTDTDVERIAGFGWQGKQAQRLAS
jgi:hypothetical protein